MLLTPFLPLLSLGAVALGSPIQADPQHDEDNDQLHSRALDDALRNSLYAIEKDFRGINWTYVADECEDTKIETLITATRGALGLAQSVFANPKRKISQSPVWNRYFLGGSKALKQWRDTPEGQAVYSTILSNLHQAGTAPKLGKKDSKGEYKTKTNVKYRCREPAGRNDCSTVKPGANGPPAAVTMHPSASNDGWQIIFCDRYFNNPVANKHISDLRNGRKKGFRETGELGTYESTMLHEWMHVNSFGMKGWGADQGDHSFITDMKNYGETVYGDRKVKSFARKNGDIINLNVVNNADNYAWFATYDFFSKECEWKSDGGFNYNDPTRRSIDYTEPQAASVDPRMQANKSGAVKREDKDDFPVNVNTDPEDPHKIVIDYISGTYEEYEKSLQDVRSPFFALNSNCYMSPTCLLGSEALDQNPKARCHCFCGGGEVNYKKEKACLGYSGSDSSVIIPTP